MFHEEELQLSKKERKELKKQRKLQERQRVSRQRTVKRWLGISLITLLTAGAIGGTVWSIATQPPVNQGDVVTTSGLHWHPELSITVKGVKQDIPQGIGLGPTEQYIHTHDTTGVIHLEFPGVVTKDDIRLKSFFKTWGKDMRSFGKNMKMVVDGKDSTEYENYVMQDKDKIELNFDS